MNKIKVFLSIIVCLLVISPTKAVVFDDGGYYLIDYTINDDIWVDQHVANNPGTEVELADGGYLGKIGKNRGRLPNFKELSCLPVPFLIFTLSFCLLVFDI